MYVGLTRGHSKLPRVTTNRKSFVRDSEVGTPSAGVRSVEDAESMTRVSASASGLRRRTATPDVHTAVY